MGRATVVAIVLITLTHPFSSKAEDPASLLDPYFPEADLAYKQAVEEELYRSHDMDNPQDLKESLRDTVHLDLFVNQP